jgi:Uma2 family endonuclease
VASPLRLDGHGSEDNIVQMWLGVYAVSHPGLDVGSNSTVFVVADNEFQPDACLVWRIPGPPGARVREDGHIEGAPLFVVEVAASSVSYDLHDKLRVYRRNGVLEYSVWRTQDRALDWFRLQDGTTSGLSRIRRA